MTEFLANKQYKAEGHTITFSKDMKVGDVISADCIVEMDGKKVTEGDAIPTPISWLLGIPGYD